MYTYGGLSSVKNPLGKLVRILSDDVKSFLSMRLIFLNLK